MGRHVCGGRCGEGGVGREVWGELVMLCRGQEYRRGWWSRWRHLTLTLNLTPTLSLSLNLTPTLSLFTSVHDCAWSDTPSKMSPATGVCFARSHSARSSFAGLCCHGGFFLPSSSVYNALISAFEASSSTITLAACPRPDQFVSIRVPYSRCLPSLKRFLRLSLKQRGVKLVERSHRRQSGAAQTAPGEVGAAADEAPRRRLAPQGQVGKSLLPYLTLPSEGANVAAIGADCTAAYPSARDASCWRNRSSRRDLVARMSESFIVAVNVRAVDSSARIRELRACFVGKPYCPLDADTVDLALFAVGWRWLVHDLRLGLGDEASAGVEAALAEAGVHAAFGVRDNLVSYKKVLLGIYRSGVCLSHDLRRLATFFRMPQRTRNLS